MRGALQRSVCLVLVVSALSGCGLLSSGGGGSSSGSGATSATGAAHGSTATEAAHGSTAGTSATVQAGVSRANRTHEYPTPVPRERIVGGWREPTQAIRAFATAYINWSAQTVSRRLRGLAQVSIGQARSAVTLVAGETASDDELRRGGIANSGVVEAIAPVVGQPDEYAVVTRERTTASASDAYQGLAPAWHVTVATVTPIANGLWVLSGWQPES